MDDEGVKRPNTSANIDAAAGTAEELERIIAQLRRAWPTVELLVRGDSGFCREELVPINWITIRKFAEQTGTLKTPSAERFAKGFSLKVNFG